MKKEQDQVERKEKAEARYQEWLKSHKSSSSPKAPKTLTDFYNPSGPRQKCEPWNSDTEIQYKNVRNLYTPF